MAGVVALGGLAAGEAPAAPPQVKGTWVDGVSTTAVTFHAQLDAGGLSTSFRFEYVSEASYLGNGGGENGFAGASRVPVPDGSAGKGSDVVVARQVAGLESKTAYVYRVVVRNLDGTVAGPVRKLTTRGGGGPLKLLDDRGWEMVSPVDKNGGEVQGRGGNAGGGVLQAATLGGAITYSSTSSFAGGGQGAPGASQYVSRRSPGGWSTENVSAALHSGGYGTEPDGVPYQLFSGDLGRGLFTGVPGLPLPGTAAPAGYANYYLRGSAGDFVALLTQADVAGLALPPAEFELAFAGASADLGTVVLSTCAALTAGATEVPDGSGCDAASPNLYAWSAAGLRQINLLPGQATGTPPGRLAAPFGAVSSDGSRVYWTDGADLYLREGAWTVQVDAALGGGGSFQTATADGSIAYFTKGEHLYRYLAGTGATFDLTPAGGVKGMLGISADGSRVYFATATAILTTQGGAVAGVAPAPDAVNYPPSTGVARVNAAGTHLLFVSASPDVAALVGYDNTDTDPKKAAFDAEVYLYDTAVGLTCVSCNPTGERPTGSASIPGAVANGKGETATRAYKPRVLAAEGRRVFFESPDSLVLQDTNNARDVYEWEAGGTGSCDPLLRGCLQLISSGRDAGGASFVDASADGADVFFLTAGSLVGSDPGSVDLYDAREDGGFPEPEPRIPCEEDACQPLPSPPDDPSPGSLVPSTGNPPVHFPKAKKGKAKKGKAKKGKGKAKKRKAKQGKKKQRQRHAARRAHR